MPRKNPMAEQDTALAGRLAAFRKARGLSRVATAAKIGIDSSRLASYEFARARVPYAVVERMASRLALNPRWLATGNGSMLSQDLGWILSQTLPVGRVVYPSTPFLVVWPECSKEYEELAEEESRLGSATVSLQDLERTLLTDYSEGSNRGEMPPPTPHSVEQLLNLVRRKCAEVGTREAARVAGVSLQRVNDWLHRRRKPGADAALRLLHWVQSGSGRTKSLSGAEDTTKARTRRKLINEDNPSPSPTKQ